jgi:hypothetical protein
MYMNNKLTGAMLFGVAGLVTAIGVTGAQIAYAIVLGGFYAGTMTGVNPPEPQSANPHWLVITAAIVLAVFGIYFLLQPQKD